MADTILVALGANLPDANGRTPLETCRWAVRQVAGLPGLRLVATSAWYRTAPVPASDQPDYVNGVALVSGPAEPGPLLAALHRIEAAAGRARGVPNAARTLDLDLLAIDQLVAAGPGLILPHPRLQDRLFVLQPLCEVAPSWRHPVLGETAAVLLQRLADAGGIAAATCKPP